MEPLTIGILCAVSIFVGLLIGCVGIGGVLLVPFLTYALGLSIHVSIAAAMLLGSNLLASRRNLETPMPPGASRDDRNSQRRPTYNSPGYGSQGRTVARHSPLWRCHVMSIFTHRCIHTRACTHACKLKIDATLSWTWLVNQGRSWARASVHAAEQKK